MSTWVVGDIHGCYNTFMKLLKNPEIKEDDTIILIGDIMDRGTDSVKMLKWAMKNITDNGKYQMILGNHEDNIIQTFNACKIRADKGYLGAKYEDIDISVMDTGYGFSEYMYAGGFEGLSDVEPVVRWMETLPLYKDITVNGQRYIIAHAWYNEDYKDTIYLRDIILWDRDIDVYTERLLYDYTPKNKEILIHGHTPTLCIKECKDKPKNEVLFRRHSINIDCGCVFYKSGGNLAAIRLEDKKVIYARRQVKIK